MAPPTAIALRREPGPLTRSLVALSLRLGLGLIFLMAGIGKFQAMKTGDYPAMIIKQFASSPLPPGQVRLFAQVLPYVEVSLGAALLAGLFTTLAATLTAVLLAQLLFGQAVLNHVDQFPGMLTYFLVNAGILWLSPVTSNYLSLDGLFFGWFWAPKPEAHYQIEEGERPKGRRV